MFSNRLAFVALALACIGAAAGGGYLATRQNTVPTPASAQVATPPTAPAAAVPAAAAETSDASVPAEPSAAARVEQPKPAVHAETSKPSRLNAVKPEASRTPAASSKSARAAAPQQLPVDASASSMASSQPPQPPPAALPRPDVAPEPPAPPDPPQKSFEEIVVPAESVIGLQTDTPLSSERARIEDRVEAHVIRDVRVNGQVAIPAGAKVIGSVSQVERGGKFKERARLGVRFHTVVLADGSRLPINTETVIREGAAPEPAQKVGAGAVGGAILGAILGGAKGAAIGAAAGGGGGAAVQMATERSAATLPQGSALTVRILSPVTVTLERN